MDIFIRRVANAKLLLDMAVLEPPTIELVFWTSKLNVFLMIRTLLTGLAQARASMDPSEACPEIDLSKIGEFGQVKFQISIEVSARESAKRFLLGKKCEQSIHQIQTQITFKAH